MGLGHFGGKEVIPLKEGNKRGNVDSIRDVLLAQPYKEARGKALDAFNVNT